MIRVKLPRGLLLASVLIVFVAFGLINSRDDASRSSVVTADGDTGLESRFEDFSMNLLLSDDAQYRLRARRLSNFDDGTSKMEQAVLQFDMQEAHWRIEAGRGELRSDQRLTLQDQVVIHQSDAQGNIATLRTPKLEVDLAARRIQSRAGIRVESANVRFTADGFEGSADQSDLVLLGQVRGEYVFD